MAKQPEPIYEGPDYIRETLLERKDFISSSIKLMASCIDSALLLSTEDKEAMVPVMAGLNEFWKSVPLANFFVNQNLRESITARLNRDMILLNYLQILDMQFILHIQSLNEAKYTVLVDKFLDSLEPISLKNENRVLSDKIYLEQKYDIGTVRELLKANSILFTIYFFKLAFPFSTAGARA